MKAPISILSIAALIILSGSAGFGQFASFARFGLDGQFTITATISDQFPGIVPIVTGGPYSGEQTAEMIQVLADGTRVTRPHPSIRVWRDSGGRTRTERPLMMMASGPLTIENMPCLTEIFDPVAGYQYYVDSVNRVTHRRKLPDKLPTMRLPMPYAIGGPVRMATVPRTGPDNSETTTESLGTKVIEGLTVVGTRMTRTYPVGAIGNDHRVVATTEMWRSPDLNVMVLTRNVDPRSGENIQGLINISRAEPDPSLFEVPADYKLTDETGSFTITITGHK